jgi:hypothetical protein
MNFRYSEMTLKEKNRRLISKVMKMAEKSQGCERPTTREQFKKTVKKSFEKNLEALKILAKK